MIKRDVFEYFKKEPDVMQVKDVVRLLHCSKNTVYKLIQAGSIPHVKVGCRYIIPRDKFVAWVNENAHGGDLHG